MALVLERGGVSGTFVETAQSSFHVAIHANSAIILSHRFISMAISEVI